MRPSGWEGGSRWGSGFEEDGEGEGASARAPSGCCRIETRVSTRRAEAMGAIPGRVTVHCWSSVWSFTDYIDVSIRSNVQMLGIRRRGYTSAGATTSLQK